MNVDVRIKFLILFYANFLLLLRVSQLFQWGVVLTLAAIFWIQGYIKKSIVYLTVYLGMELLVLLVLDHLSEDMAPMGSMLLVGGRFMFPCFMAGSLILTTTCVHELIQVFRRLRIPEGIILTLAVMLRFLPTVRFEHEKIKQSLVLRGVFPTIMQKVSHPIQYFEYCMVPLLMLASRVSQELTIAALTKGVNLQSRKTSYRDYYFKGWDYFWLLAIAVQIVLVEVFR